MTAHHQQRGRSESAIERVARALDTAGITYKRARSGHIQASCPVHGADRVPSLSIDQRGDRVLLHCHACGAPQRELAEAIGLAVHELWDEPLQACERCNRPTLKRPDGRWLHDICAAKFDGTPITRTARSAQPRTSQRIGALPPRLYSSSTPDPTAGFATTATYDHVDADTGEIVARSVRQEVTVDGRTSKRFHQEYATAAGQWRKRKSALPAGARIPLYRAPELRQAIASGGVVWLCEGHKDAEALLAAGVDEATTNIAGALNLTADEAAQLSDAIVVVCIDRDRAGYERALLVEQLLREVAAELRYVLPVPTHKGADAADHLAAGHGIAEFIPVELEGLQELAVLAHADQILDALAGIPDEITARLKLDEADSARHARRWAIEAGRDLLKMHQALGGHTTPTWDAAVEITRRCHLLATVDPTDDVAHLLNEPATQPDTDSDDSNVVALPTSGNRRPEHPIAMSRDQWRYDEGDNCSRGVYLWVKQPGYWDRVADLPYVQAAIIRRDGTGRRIGTDYLLSAEADSRGLIITHQGLRDGSWANELGLSLSDDSKVQNAASTAIRDMGSRAVTREAVPRIDETGQIGIATPETLPSGYMVCSPVERDQALTTWATIATAVAESPKLALVLGASTIAPFLGGLGAQSHFMSVYGDPNQGKTTALQLAGSVWGDTATRGASVVTGWNSTQIGALRYCGSLGVLPPIFDESGMAPWSTPAEWGKFIYDLCEGAQRRTAEQRGPGVRVTNPWAGILLMAGNGRLTDGLGAGKYAGVAKRVVELATPLTTSADQAEQLSQLTATAYGHLGVHVLESTTVDDVRSLIADTAVDLPLPAAGSGRTVVKSLQAHVAGAALIDSIVGTGTTLRDAALDAALEYLDQWDEPEHDADRILHEIQDSMSREPSTWPTVSDYLRIREPFDTEGSQAIPRHGVAPSINGVRDNEGRWLAVFTKPWAGFADAHEIDASVAVRELHKRGHLLISEGQRRRGEWVYRQRLGETLHRVYKLRMDALTDNPQHTTEPEPETVDVPGCSGSVPGDVPGDNMPVTRDVLGVPGNHTEKLHMTRAKAESEPEGPCQVCGETAVIQFNGRWQHAGCEEIIPTPSEPEQRQEETVVRPPSAGARPARFSAPAAALSGGVLHQAGSSEQVPFQPQHLGEVALMTAQLRLGWGGGEDRLPDPGQVWLYPDAVESLGLPATINLPDEIQTPEKRRKTVADAFAKLNDHPAVTEAIAQGWQLGQGGALRPWTRMWHPDHLRNGAVLVFMPWEQISDVALTTDTNGEPCDPQTLVDRLEQFARGAGVSYRLTPAATGLDLIDHTRPPRRDETDTMGQSRNRVALIRGIPAELPDFLRAKNDARFNQLETDFSWWRSWENLLDSEKSARYAVAFDRGRSYLGPWSNIELGIDGLTHSTNPIWNGKETPGYWLVDRWEWDDWGLPDPGQFSGADYGNGRCWVTTHTLRQIAAAGITPTIHEAWTWTNSARYLEPAAKRLRQALDMHLDDAVVATIKGLYTSTVGKLGERDHRDDYHLWRPDWRHHIIASSRTAILHTLRTARDLTGAIPLAVDRDTIVYASDSDQPDQAWPGDPKKLGHGIGAWKPVAISPLNEWGPTHLPEQGKVNRRWRYTDAMSAMTNWTDS